MSPSVLVVTHGASGAAMLAAVERLMGPDAVRDIQALEIQIGEPRDEVRRRIRDAVAQLDHGGGVLVATDLYGSTPTNCACELLSTGASVAVLSGVNLPIVMKLATVRATAGSPAVLANAAADTGVKSIRVTVGGAA